MGASRIHIEGHPGKGAHSPVWAIRREPGEHLVPQTSVVNLDSAESVSVATLVPSMGTGGSSPGATGFVARSESTEWARTALSRCQSNCGATSSTTGSV